MNRRQLLQGILAGGTAAIVSQFNVPEIVAEEIQEEVIKDLQKPERIYVQGPKQIYDTREVWTSTSRVREVYQHFVADELAKRFDEKVVEQLKPKIPTTVRRLVGAIDQDLSVADLEHKKVILQMPKVDVDTAKGVFSKGEPRLVLKAGAEYKKGLLGSEEVRVGYIQESLVDRFGKKL
jgi:hypothetical protein